MPKSETGQTRRFDPQLVTSGLTQSTNIARPARLVRFVPNPGIVTEPAQDLSQTSAPTFNLEQYQPGEQSCGIGRDRLGKSSACLLDHLVGTSEQRRRNFDAESFCGFEIDQ
jgi:hypothetical protein